MVKYYIVVSDVIVDRVSYPEFFNCAKVGDYFIVINDLEKYLKTGEGLSDKKVTGHFFTVDKYGKHSLS